MKLFHNITITHRLILIFAILIAGFIALSTAYQRLLNVEHEYIDLIQHANEFDVLSDKVMLAAEDLADKAYNFMLVKDMRYAEDFFDDDSFYQLGENVKQLETLIDQPKILAVLNNLRTAWLEYGEAFDNQINAQMLLGFNENSGMIGNMRVAINSVADAIAPLNYPPLTITLLQIRYHEKDFMIETNKFEHVNLLHDKLAIFTILLDQAQLPDYQKDAIIYSLNVYKQAFDDLVTATYRLEARTEDTDTAHLALIAINKILNDQRILLTQQGAENLQKTKEQANFFMTITLIIAGGSIALTLLLLALSLRTSLGRLQNTVRRISNGDLTARSQLKTKDELGMLGRAIDTLLNERMTVFARAERENELLNQSIISIIETVARMSQKDLTIKAVVAEDITGTIADALNLMTSETSDVLVRIRSISQAVEQAASAVHEQAENVSRVAAQERQLVQKSAEGLHSAGQALGQLAQGAQDANSKADTAIVKTRQALAAVTTSVQGIDKIREVIRETEKRIKRLGERSQEINGAVNLINAIAERTNILALNASMHAASAGEAGRGFAVVADEVQRLAESSQKATSDIATMVHAIREETSDTLETMNRLIAQVAEGTRQAQDAGQKMRESEATTTDLVKSVREMAEGAGQQAQSALDLRKQSQVIIRSTEQTNTALKEQATYTVRLMDYANTLREAVSVFRLPGSGSFF